MNGISAVLPSRPLQPCSWLNRLDAAADSKTSNNHHTVHAREVDLWLHEPLLYVRTARQEERPLQISGSRSSMWKLEVALIARLAFSFRLGIAGSDRLA
jgi:hypothetical protein